LLPTLENRLLLFERREVSGSRSGLLKLPDPGFGVAKRTTTGGQGGEAPFVVVSLFNNVFV
jgi:hypothetical protein